MEKRFKYQTAGTCSRGIEIVTEDDVVREVRFDGGCHGNTQGISSLVCGMKVDEIITRLGGIRCRNKETSCPDQLARALAQMKEAGC